VAQAGMEKSGIKAFSDAVIAIINSIMVWKMKVPHGADTVSLKTDSPLKA
jgi:uncharacterized membrane protein